MIVTRSTVCSWHSGEAVERSSWRFTFPTLRDAKLSCFLHSQYVLGTAEKMYLQHHRLVAVAGVKRTAREKAQSQRRFDVLTEGVSFSSDRSLSPCSKNSLVTNSATWRERKDECRAASIDSSYRLIVFWINQLLVWSIKMPVTINWSPRWWCEIAWFDDIQCTITQDKEK